MAATLPTSRRSASIRVWRILAMVAPLAGLVIGMLVVVGAFG